jgi:hypothetical protein
MDLCNIPIKLGIIISILEKLIEELKKKKKVSEISRFGDLVDSVCLDMQILVLTLEAVH